MIFTVTDKNFNRICTLPQAINIQWIQRFYSCGQFSFQLPASANITDDWHYILCDERENVGIIQQKTYSQNIKGKFVQISGFFMEHELSDAVLINYHPEYDSSHMKEYLHKKIGRMIKSAMESGDPLFWYNESDEMFGKYTSYQISDDSVFNFIITNQDAMSAAYELSKLNETSFVYKLDIWETGLKSKKLQMISSKENKNVIFREKQIGDLSIVYDDSNYKNCVKVLGPTVSDSQIIVDYKSDDVINGSEPEKWIVLDNTGLPLTETKVDDAGLDFEQHIDDEEIIKGTMVTNAQAELQNYQKVVNISYKIIDLGEYEYNKDFYLGDIITVEIESLNITETRQITEVEEVWKGNQHIIYLTLGENRQSIIDKAARVANQSTVSKATSKTSNTTISSAPSEPIDYITTVTAGKITTSGGTGATTVSCSTNKKYIKVYNENGALVMSAIINNNTVTGVCTRIGTIQNVTDTSFQVFIGAPSSGTTFYWEVYG